MMARKQTSTIRAVYGKTEDCYLNLIRWFPLRPLRTEADLAAAVAVIDELLDRALWQPRSKITLTCSATWSRPTRPR